MNPNMGHAFWLIKGQVVAGNYVGGREESAIVTIRY
jgi:hypothetical protein